MKNKFIQTADAPKAIGPYSQAVQTGNTLYISGQIPINPENGEMEAAEIKLQTKRVLKNVNAILNAAGFDKTSVVKTTCLLTDMDNFADMNEVYSRFFESHKPARACFAVKTLPKNSLIEIDAIAVKE